MVLWQRELIYLSLKEPEDREGALNKQLLGMKRSYLAEVKCRREHSRKRKNMCKDPWRNKCDVIKELEGIKAWGRVTNCNVVEVVGTRANQAQKSYVKGMPGWFSQLSIQLLISAQVMISPFLNSSPTQGSALTIQNLLGLLSLSLPLCPFPICILSLSLFLSLSK